MFIKTMLILVCFVCMLTIGCERTVVDSQPTGPTWTFLGLSGKPVERLVIAEPYIYACARREGLWRLNLQESDTNWVYLGLADTSLNRQTLGVVDVVISQDNPNWLLAIVYIGGLFRSIDNGKTWVQVTNGLEFDEKQVKPQRLLKYPDFVISTGSGVVFKSGNFGLSWDVLHGEGPGLLEIEELKKHPIYDHIIWQGGQTGSGTSFLSISSNFGSTWNDFFPLPSFFDFGVSDIALHPIDSLTVYVADGDIIAKSVDIGKTWEVVLQQGLTAILIDPRDPSHIWAGTAPLMETFDAGLTWQEWTEPPPEEIAVLDMVWDDERKAIYLGLLDGVYRFIP